MKKIHVIVRKKDKGGKPLTLLNLRDEVVNFLYRDTVANSTKVDQQFFVLMYFASLKVGDKPYLEKLFDAALPRFHRLSVALAQKKTYLVTREYRAKVEEFGLVDFFANDIFFVLAEAVLNIDSIEARYGNLYDDKPEIANVINLLKTKYRPLIIDDYALFVSSRIRDDRYDDDGTVHDLSKSVYRTIQMRNARNLELNLQRYTRVKNVRSNSPIVLELIQNVDPQIIFDLWNKYHVVEYIKGTLKFIDSSPTIAGIVSGVTAGVLSPILVDRYREHQSINGAKDPRRKKTAREAFQLAKAQHGEGLDDLNGRLVESVLNANEYLMREVERLNAALEAEQNKSDAAQDKETIKRLKARISELENLEISAKEVNDEQSDPEEQST
jgi:hypothetical protein